MHLKILSGQWQPYFHSLNMSINRVVGAICTKSDSCSLTHWPLGNLNKFQTCNFQTDFCENCEIALLWMSLDFTDNQSTLVQVMAWCHKATSHYLSQCWLRSLPPYGVTRPQWVNILRLRQHCRHFTDSVFKCIFFNENISILIQISLKFLSKGPVNKITSLDQIMAWHRPGAKWLSEPMMA